jgi:hypothetical protein
MEIALFLGDNLLLTGNDIQIEQLACFGSNCSSLRARTTVQDQITFKRAYMRPMELSHKASVRWSLIYPNLQTGLRRPSSCDQTKLGYISIHLTAGIEYTP